MRDTALLWKHSWWCALIEKPTEMTSGTHDRTVLSGLVEFLGEEAKPEVKDVQVKVSKPATSGDLATWERIHHCSLPEDAKQFYLVHNGLCLCWNYAYTNVIVQLGRINVNSLSQLQQLGQGSPPSSSSSSSSRSHPSLLDLNCEVTEGTEWEPSFSKSCKAFSLDYCPSCGHICLVCRTASQDPSSSVVWGVWLLDLSLSWHFLCSSLSDYLRLATVHLGIRQWPYALTNNRLSPQHERWFHIFVPKRLEVDLMRTTATGSDETPFINSVDVTKLLQQKGSHDKRSKDTRVQHSTKKPPLSR